MLTETINIRPILIDQNGGICYHAAVVLKNIKKVGIYGIVMGFLFFGLEALNYKALVRQVSMELYGAAIGLTFLALGIWLGLTLTQKKSIWKKKKRPADTNLSEREYEVLSLMANGQSNQEIADQLFVSLNTVKTHISNIFAKLDVQRRTQAIQRAREMNLI